MLSFKPLRLDRPTRTAVRAIAAAAVVIASSVAGFAHDEGHDESMAHQAAMPGSPRIVAVSETYELVGILEGAALRLYLDRMSDTSAVTGAKVEVTVAGKRGPAEPQPDGTYIFKSDSLVHPDEEEVTVSVTEDGGTHLLTGVLKGSGAGHDHAHDDEHGRDHSIRHHGSDGLFGTIVLPESATRAAQKLGIDPAAIERSLSRAEVVFGIPLALGLLIGAMVRGRRAALIIVALILVVATATAVKADEGLERHDHDAPSAAIAGGAPQRLPDGRIFLPKPTQHLLDIGTRVLAPETARRSVRLVGRVISDPNRSGLVQSTIGGRIEAPKAGLPTLGQRVSAGDILAYVQPAFLPIDASDVQQTAGNLEQQIALTRAKITRTEQLVARDAASRATLQDLQIELEGLQKRRTELGHSKVRPEELTAPVDGIVAAVKVVAGQVVSTTDLVFQIVDPQSFWVEAIAFDQIEMDAVGAARAVLGDGASLQLKYVGRSRTLQQQSTILHFAIENPPASLDVGMPVTVLVETGAPVTALLVPRSGIAQAPNGQAVVFQRKAPELYEPRAVRFEPFDGERVRILSGVEAGDRIIVRNAQLVNQIR